MDTSLAAGIKEEIDKGFKVKRIGFYRNSIYKKQFPRGTWLEVKGLAVSGQLIEIDMEAHKVKQKNYA